MMANENGGSTFYAVLLDETENVGDPDLIRRCKGKLFTAYIYDDGEQTHLCEFTPSFWLEEMDNVPNVDADWSEADEYEMDRLSMDLLDLRNPEFGIYVHCHVIESLPPSRRVELGRFESMEEAREEYQGNPIW